MLNSIKIKGYKLLKDKEIELTDLGKINYLTGKNGSGKSLVMQCLNLIRDGTQRDGKKYFGDLTSVIHENFEVEIEYKTRWLERGTAERDIIQKDTFKLESRTQNLFHIKLVESGSRTAGVTFTRSHDFSYVSPSIPSAEIIGLDFSNQLLFQPLTFHDSFTHEAEQFIRKFLNNYFHPINPIRMIIRSVYDRETIQIEFTDGEIINFQALPSGERSIFQLLLQMYNWVINVSDNREFKSYLLCIEEPEATLHPGLQKYLPVIFERVLKEVPSKDIQIIVATHSPFILSGSRAVNTTSQKVYLLEKGESMDLSLLHTRKSGYSSDRCLSVASSMLGAGLEDLNTTTRTCEKYNIFYCEGSDKSIKDSDIYSLIFPKDNSGIKNIFISCGGADTARDSYFSARPCTNLFFGDTSKVFLLIDNSNSKKGWTFNDGNTVKTGEERPTFTEEERDKYINENPDFRILKRKEIENYIFDPRVVSKLEGIDETKMNHILDELSQIDFSTEVKDIVHNSKSLKFLEQKKLELAEIILRDKAEIYNELKECIFPNE